SSRSQASLDLPAPEGPRISTAFGPISTAEAWMVVLPTSPSPGGGRSADEVRRGGVIDAGAGRGRTQRLDHFAGSRTMKRAPSTLGSSPGAAGALRFSAQMVPPCASTICLEIDRPSP